MIVNKLVVTGYIDYEHDYGSESIHRVEDAYEKAKELFGFHDVSNLELDKNGDYRKFVIGVSLEDDLGKAEDSIKEFISFIDEMASVRDENKGYNNLVYHDFVYENNEYVLRKTNEDSYWIFKRDVERDLSPVKVSREVADALSRLSKDEWMKQYNLIAHCKGYSGNGVLMRSIYTPEQKVLEKMQPLEFAKCLVLGYEVEDDKN